MANEIGKDDQHQGLEAWLKTYGACLASMRLQVQTPVTQEQIKI
jgi:hypothetical protein